LILQDIQDRKKYLYMIFTDTSTAAKIPVGKHNPLQRSMCKK